MNKMKTMKRTVWLGVAVMLTGVLVSGMGSSAAVKTQERTGASNTATIMTQDGQKRVFSVELADDKEKQRTGMMYRTELQEDHGMLFLFEAITEHSFWMRNTLISLDMIFIEKDGTIQHVHSRAKPQDDTQITSGKPSKAVLEINGGLSDKLGITAGSIIYHPAFNNTHLLEK